MALKRYSVKELDKICTDIFYNFMSSTEEKFFDETEYLEFDKNFPTPMDMLYKELCNTIEENEARIKLIKEGIEELKNDKEAVESLQEQLQPLLEEKEHFTNSCMSYMKELYQKTGRTDYSRNVVRIPLDKRINSYYDDLVLQVGFYDDIAVAKGKYEDYKKLKTQAERIDFIKSNTEITHLSLVVLSANSEYPIAIIQIRGDLLFDDPRVESSNVCLLPKKFAEFGKLTLADTVSGTQNNDLRQLLQSKIDLDKENMEVLADMDIRGSNYKLLKAKTDQGSYTFIRYVCPSTERVYYNIINPQYIKVSDFYEEGNYESYLEAWWNVCHVGANPREGRMARC